MTDRTDEILQRLDALKEELRTALAQQIAKTYEVAAPALQQSQEQLLRAIQNVNQTSSLAVRRLARGGKTPVRCLFLVHMNEAWDALAPVYEAMRDADDFAPIIATIPRSMPPDGRIAGEDDNHVELERAGVPHLRLGMEPSEALDIVKALEPDILFRQQPWDKMLPPAFATEQLSFTRLCYVPYGFMAVRRFSPQEKADLPFSPLHTDLNFHRLCWRIFCETDMHMGMFAKTAARRGANVVVTGFPKFDRLLQRAKSAPPFWPVPARDGRRRFRVIWAPHHSIGGDWLGFGTFAATYRDMLQWARADADTEFVMKPHPHLWSRAVGTYRLLSVEELDAYLKQWNLLPNTAIVEGGDYGPLFAASDIMLTDGVSFLSEYPLFEKPVLFIDSGHHCGFNEAGTVALECANTVQSIAEARALCEKLRGGMPDPQAALQKSARARLMPFPGASSQKILDAIRAGLEQERGAA